MDQVANYTATMVAPRTHEQNIMILRLSPQILEDRLGPKPLHQVPVVNLPMFDRAVDVVGLCVGYSFISDKVIEVVNSSLRSQVSGLVGNGRTSSTSVRGGR